MNARPPTPPSPATAAPAPRWPAYLLACTFALLMQPATNLHRLPGIDAGLFAYAGKLIRRGFVPYRDFWDHKPPAIFYTEALAHSLFGPSWLGPSLLQALVSVVCAAALVRLSVALFSSSLARSVFVIGALLGLHHFANADNSNLTETYQTLPLLGCLLLLQPFAAAPSRARLVGAGASLAVAFLFRPNAASLLLVSVAILGCRAQVAGRLRAFTREVVPFGLGFGAVLALVTAYFARHGVAGELWFAAVGYNLTVYPTLATPFNSGSELGRFFMLRSQHLVWPLYAMFAAAAILYAVEARRHGRTLPFEQRLAIAALWAVSDLSLALFTGRNYGHYVIALVPSAAFAGALLLEVAGRYDARKARPALLAFVVLMGMAWLPQTPLLAQLWTQGVRVARSRCPTADEKLASSLKPIVTRDTRVLSWGLSQSVGAILGQKPATALLTTLHLRSEYGRKRWASELLRALAGPEVVAVLVSDRTLDSEVRRGPKHAPDTPFALTRAEVAAVLRKDYTRMSWDFSDTAVYVRSELASKLRKKQKLPATCREYTAAPINWYEPATKKSKKKKASRKKTQ